MEAEREHPACLVLLEGGEGEIVEKKSRFIANIRCVETEEEAQHFIEEMKKKYWDARHNCSAYVVGMQGEMTRCSDDGEPAQTAGIPMLQVLLNRKIRNVAVVVTRYFGGVLLGTGGLVRAYTKAVQEGLKNCKIGLKRYGVRWQIRTDYNSVGRILSILSEEELIQEKAEYTDQVCLQVLVPAEKEKSLREKLTEATNGKAVMSEIDRTYFIDKKELL